MLRNAGTVDHVERLGVGHRDVAALGWLSSRELEAGAALLLPPVLADLLSHQLVHRHHPWRVPKEVVVALRHRQSPPRLVAAACRTGSPGALTR